MKIHEFGEQGNPVLLLLPGTCCFWKGTFGHVIEELSKDFLVGAVAYSGFDEESDDEFDTVLLETERIEIYVGEHYNNQICAAYGSSLGGSFVAQLAARGKIHMKYGIIGSSDFDQSRALAAKLKAALMGKVIYPFIHTGITVYPLCRNGMSSKWHLPIRITKPLCRWWDVTNTI